MTASFGTLWLICREALDAGETEAALAWSGHGIDPLPMAEPSARRLRRPPKATKTAGTMHWRSHSTTTSDLSQSTLSKRWASPPPAESWAECLRLIAAADRLRAETSYRWRFACEHRPLDAARAAAHEALGETPPRRHGEGHDLDWHEAAAYARRARGERQRPHHGWDSLTPTEHQVVALVADGLTNPQIAQRLLIARSTVKTHLTPSSPRPVYAPGPNSPPKQPGGHSRSGSEGRPPRAPAPGRHPPFHAER